MVVPLQGDGDALVATARLHLARRLVLDQQLEGELKHLDGRLGQKQGLEAA